ncbi:MAG: decaprenyl-phosphate phosphoribosyltransferase [Vicinamibacteria bacterium]|jgi:4-hydroxybenzoate polyprenyltransferase|nr:decaprenyl-phosphate phosphoribosyltransferase [Vicinamibacteria bacterium]
MSVGPIFASLRPHQWTKNLLVFAALPLSIRLFDVESVVRSLAAFALFCALSGTVYLINDLADVERDRLHPLKRLRPIASGQLSARVAICVAWVLGLGSLAASFALGWRFACAASAYLALNLLYSFWLKEVLIIDAISLSLGFVIRAVAGGLAIQVHIGDWLLICTILLALFLTLCKRRHELTSLNDTAVLHRRILSEYSPYLLDQMIAVVTASCVTAYALATTAQDTIEKYHTHRLTWTLPFVLYGIFRYLYLVHRKEQGGSPTDILLYDRPLLINVFLWGLAIVVIVYSAPAALVGH